MNETHEPEMPLPGWPGSHADSELTGPDEDECIVVTVHGVRHYLHAATARELQVSLEKTLVEYNAVCDNAGAPRV